MKPANNLVVEMTDKDVQDNLVDIIEGMERIRKESITNLVASDEQKMDYLRLTGELASCLKSFIKENNLNDHVSAVNDLVNNDLLLRNYDASQGDFWNNREPRLKTAMDDCSGVLLRDDLVSESQLYHIFQALKYLSIKSKEDRDDVYETILPFNSLLNESSLTSPDISSYLIKQLLNNVANNGIGVKVDIDALKFIKGLEQAGAFYVDVPAKNYESMKKHFPKTILIEEGGQKYARITFGDKENKEGINAFKLLQEYAQFDLGESEENLVKKMSNFYSFGKKFLEDMKAKIGVKEESLKPIRGLESKVLVLDMSSGDNGKTKTQNQWIEYWNNINDGRRFASAADLYKVFKQLRETTDDEAKILIDSLRKDFGNSRIVTSTRLIYQPDNENAKIIHNYCNKNTDLIKEADVKVPTYLGAPIAENINDEDCSLYLKMLFDTEDNMEEITSVLEYISDKSRENIKLWTPPIKSNQYYTRKKAFDRAVGFDYYVDDFLVDGYFRMNDYGRSRGVAENQQS